MDDISNHRHRNYKNNCGNTLHNHKSMVYVIVLILTYAFGYFTASQVRQTYNTPSVTSAYIIQANLSTLHKSNAHNMFGQACANPIKPEYVRSTILNKIYDGVSPYENFPPAHIAPLLKPQSMKGWGSNGEVFENLIKKVRPRTIIEIGTFLGASTTHMANLTRNLGLETQILCVDDFRGWPGFRDYFSFLAMENGNVMLMAQFLQNVVSLNSSEVILPIPFSTNTALGTLCEWGVMGDLIEVDAGHDFHSAWLDINLAHKLLKPGGVMFGHDYFTSVDNYGVRRAIDLFAQVHGYKVNVDGQHWVLE